LLLLLLRLLSHVSGLVLDHQAARCNAS